MRRGLMIAGCAAAAVLALYSCSMHAVIATDDRGRVVEVSAVRIESSLRRVALAVLVAGGHVAFEFRWLKAWTGDADVRLDGLSLR